MVNRETSGAHLGGYRWDMEKLRRRLRRGRGWVHFRFMAPDARSVSLAGDFNAWTADGSVQLERRADGSWELILALTEGEYEYKFVVDGSWVNDPANPTKVANSFGTANDVLKVHAATGTATGAAGMN